MGSLTSRPKVPKQSSPQIVYVPQPVYTPAPTPTYTPPPASINTPLPEAPSSEEDRRAEARAQSLLTRDRSRFGTVTTSFRGLLNLASGGATKTLLGE